MCTLVSQQVVTARKEHDDMSCEWIIYNGHNLEDMLSPSELMHVEEAKKRKWKILPGMKYIRQFSKDGGDVWTFRAAPELHAICIKHKLYPEC